MVSEIGGGRETAAPRSPVGRRRARRLGRRQGIRIADQPLHHSYPRTTMTDDRVILYLFAATFLVVIVYGIVQLLKVRKAKDDHKRSAMGVARGEPETPGGKTPAKR